MGVLGLAVSSSGLHVRGIRIRESDTSNGHLCGAKVEVS